MPELTVADEIDTRYLQRLVGSRDFARHVYTAAGITTETGCETGFEVAKILGSKKPLISPVATGDPFSMEPAREELLDYFAKEIAASCIYECYFLMDVHFHPSHDLRPSLGDLESLYHRTRNTEGSGLCYLPILGIGAIDDCAASVDLLLLQSIYSARSPDLPLSPPEFIDRIYSSLSAKSALDPLSRDTSPFLISGSLEDSELIRSHIVRFRAGHCINEDLGDLTRFAHMIRLSRSVRSPSHE